MPFFNDINFTPCQRLIGLDFLEATWPLTVRCIHLKTTAGEWGFYHLSPVWDRNVTAVDVTGVVTRSQ
jgi:hypothetical protein